MAETSLRVSRSCEIPLSEITWRADPTGGPGGQHANRAATRVEARFDVEASASLGPRQRARLLERLGPVVGARAGGSRSQARNRAVALEALRARLADALRVEPTRVATRPRPGARTARLDAKRRRARTKRDRGWRPEPGE